MFLSRFSIALATLILSANAFAANSVQMTVDGGNVFIGVSLDLQTEVAKRLEDVLLKTPSVKEVKNMYADPGTLYEGPGFQMQRGKLNPGYISIRLQIPAGQYSSSIVQGTFVRMTAIGGPIGAFHKALLESTSRHVVTKSNPGILNPAEGEANVLENDGFGSGNVSCSFSYIHRDVSTCEFNLVK